MHATIYDDPHIIKSTFPDVIFSAYRDQLEISLQCRHQTSAEGDSIKSSKEGHVGSASITSESYQPSETNNSAPRCPGPSDTHPRRSFGLTQCAQSKPSCQSRPVRKGILPNDPASKEGGGPLDRILASMTFGPRDRTFCYNLSNGWEDSLKASAESEVAKYLNEVVNCARRFFNDGAQVPERDDDFVFAARYTDRAVKTDGTEQKPHIVLVPRCLAKESDGWRHVRAVGELKSNVNYSKQELVDEIAERTSLCFGRQRARRFVLAFSLLGTKMALWKYDRSGAIVSQEFDIRENPIDFLRVILGLALGPDYYVGYDPSFAYKDRRRIVELNGKDYEVMLVIQPENVNMGRGTVVQHVRDEEGREFAMKDQWVDLSGTTNELSLLEKLEEMNVQKVPRLVDYQIIRFKVGDEVVLDSTANDRAAYGSTWLEEMGIDIRIHYRLLMTPYGDDLRSFRSLKELVSVFRDFVEGIRDIREKEIVHQDISSGNLILVEEGESSCRRGYIIDFDRADYVKYIGRASGERTMHGTLQFMAIDILLRKVAQHECYHDLESLFYVLIWVCFKHEGPGVERHEFDSKRSPVQQWEGRGDAETNLTGLAYLKISHTESDAAFEEFILDELPDYFRQSEVMTELLEKLRAIVFRQTPSKRGRNKARVILDREKSMKDRDMHDVFTEIFGVFDEALDRITNEPTPGSEKEATSAPECKVTA